MLGMDVVNRHIADMKSATRLTDRRNAAQNLDNYLQENVDDICEKLDISSVLAERKAENLGYTWSTLFQEVNSYFSKETEKATISGQNKSACYSVVCTVFKKATRTGRPRLNWQKVYDFIISNLDKERLATLYGPRLMNMLEQFLAIEMYRELMDAPAWANIIKILLKVYGKYHITSSSVLNCLQICVSLGSNFSDVIPTLRHRVVTFYRDIVNRNPDVLHHDALPYLKGISELCKKNACEFRSILCKFGEYVIPSLIPPQTLTEEQMDALVEFLRIQYSLHMPLDVVIDSEGFYAGDISKWKDIVRTVYSYCIDTIEEIVNKLDHARSNIKLSDDLLTLAAKCTKQISTNIFNENESSEDEGLAPKKKMRFKSFNALVSDISRKPVTEGFFVWLRYFAQVLNNFPELVETKVAYSDLTQIGCSLFSVVKLTARTEFYSYFLSLLNVEKHLRSKEIINERSETWATVWEICIKSISITTDHEAACTLLRQIMKEIQPPDVMPLLSLYLNDSMSKRKCSVELLAELLSLYTVPAQMKSYSCLSDYSLLEEEITATTNARWELLKWLLKPSNHTFGCEPLIAALLCSLVVKQSHALILEEADLDISPEMETFEFELILLKICFVHAQNLKSQNVTELVSKQPQFKYILNGNFADRLADALLRDLDKLPLMKPNSLTLQPNREYNKFTSKLCLYMNVLDIMERHAIGQSLNAELAPNFIKTLEKVFSTGIQRCNEFIQACFNPVHENQVRKKPEDIQLLIEFTKVLFIKANTSICDKVRDMLIQQFTAEALWHFKRVFRSNLARYISEVSQNNNSSANNLLIIDSELTSTLKRIGLPNAAELHLILRTDKRYESMSFEALRFLVSYGLMCGHRSSFFNELITDLTNENACTANPFLFDAFFEVISRLAKLLADTDLRGLVPAFNAMLQRCCRNYYKIPKCAVKIWDMMKELIPIVAPFEDPNRNHFMVLVGTCYTFLKHENQKAPPLCVYRKAMETLSELAKYDKNSGWTVFKPSNDQPLSILEDLHNPIANKSQLVRMWVIDAICSVFENALPYDYSNTPSSPGQAVAGEEYQKKRKTFLEILYKRLLEAFDVEANLSSDENYEESINRTSTVISCLTRLIFTFPYTTKTVVMFLFLIVKLKHIDVRVTNRALRYASPNALKTICRHLTHVLKQTILLKQGISDIPYQLFGCNELASFFDEFHKEICAELFQQDGKLQLEFMASQLKKSVQDLVKSSYGLIMARVTPALTILHYGMDNPQNLNLVSYNNVHTSLIKILGGKDVADTLLTTHLGDVVLNLVSLVFDPTITNKWGLSDIRMTEPLLTHHSESIIERSLEFLQSISPLKDLTVIGYLAQTSHESIYKILLTLAVRIHEAHDELEKFWKLHHFSFFVNLLLKEPPGIFSSMKEYVCNFVFNTYFRLLKSDNTGSENKLRLKQIIMFLIREVIGKIIEVHSDELKIYFDPIVRSVVSAVDRSRELIPLAKEILDFLLITHGQTFSQSIEYLDPFPVNVVEFHEYHSVQREKKYGSRGVVEWSLAKEFEALLRKPEGTFHQVEFCAKERLRFLRELLANRKRDLEKLVRALESRRFSEECSSDPLHNIIQMLTGIVLSSHYDEQVVHEASRCLGEIGPVDLSVLVLPPYKRQGRITEERRALLEIIKMIAGFLTSDDIRLVATAGRSLRELLRFNECIDLFNEEVSDDVHLHNMLKPFHCIYVFRRRKSSDKIDAAMLESKLGMNEMNEGIDYRNWIQKLTTGLIECFKENTSMVTELIPLCQQRVDFCENILPYIVYLSLYSGRTNINVKRTLGGYFRNFFSKFVSLSSSSPEPARSFTPSTLGTTNVSIFMNKLALRILIRSIQFLRRHSIPDEIKGKLRPAAWGNNFWMDINYLDVARAAQYCGAYLTSIMYIEIAATEMELSGGGHSSRDLRNTEQDCDEEFYSQGVSVRNRGEAAKIERLLLKAYSSIGEADAIYGCGSARFSDVESSMHHMAQTMDWHRLLLLANGSYVSQDSCHEPQVALAMKHLGMYNVLWGYLKGIQSLETEFPEDLVQAQYECGWRLTKWELNAEKPVYIKDESESSSILSGFQACIYESIQSGIIDDAPTHIKAVKSGFKGIQRELKHASLESSENIYGFLSRLQMLRVVEDFFDKSEGRELDDFLKKWKFQDRIPVGDFKYQEPALFLRNVLLREYDKKNPANLERDINESFLLLITKAREAGRLDYAESCATAMTSLSDRPSIARELEVAKNNWARGGKGADLARSIVSRLIKKCPTEDNLFPALLLLYGEWLSITNCERPSVILEKYLQKSCQIYEKKNNAASTNDISNAYVVLAKYADAQYQQVTKYIKSTVFQDKVSFLAKAKEQVKQMELTVDGEAQKKLFLSRRQCVNDEEEIKHIEKQRRSFLELALRHYLRGLKSSNENDLLIFRAIALWLENEDEYDAKDDRTTEIFGEEKLPSYKYIVVLHQLSARLNKASSRRNCLLKEILLKCAEDHPFHTLPVLLTQANLHKDQNLPPKSSSLKVQLADRVEAAAVIVAHLKKVLKLKEVVSSMELLWLALIDFANIEDRAANATVPSKNVPSNIMKRLRNLNQIAVPTCSVPVLQSGNYKESVIYICGFENTYGLVGGINSPKKIKCKGSNGIAYNMLLKGQDDLRQDAVMQQVFGVMNKLLQVEPRTRTRCLQIRTYKVIPLSQRTGLIEWVENTQTFGEYLTGNGNEPGAHGRYRSNDYKPIECRKRMIDARGKDAAARFTAYETICENFKPVFRHFFFENFREAGVFFEKKLAYTRSVATTSIIGYILGLGDRHVLNILIDKSTAEFIHIDLGVAFEQGRLLPTPETIPFRLTRDVIDGMGISGVEGVFRRSCEMTLEVLRNNAEIIITVLQVLLYDPLYMWALTNDRVAKLQPSDSARNGRKSNAIEKADDSVKERNNSAMRVLLRLRQKLVGIEEEGGDNGANSSGSSLSVDGHVALLIQRAINPHNLSKLFPGWQPYL